MNNSRFLKRQRKELPGWQEQGWVSNENGKAILADVSGKSSSSHLLTYALGILGVLLFSSGVITWFAVNWQEMAKLTKLVVLLGSLYICYGIGGYLHNNDRSPGIAQALFLLGVILFGANIMLIAKIYHIDEHYPNGVLIWSLGGIISAYLLRSQATMVAAIALASIWAGLERFGFRNLDVRFILLWPSFLPAIYLFRWFASLHLAMLSIIIWSLTSCFFVDTFWGKTTGLYLVQIYFIIYLAGFTIGMLMETTDRFKAFARLIQNYFVLATLISLYILTFPRVQSGLSSIWDNSFRNTAPTSTVVITVVAMLAAVLLANWHRLLTAGPQRPRYLKYGQHLIAAAAILIIANLFLSGVHGSWMALAFNFLFFAGVIWLMFAGANTHNRFLVNIAFIFFVIVLLSRYFDTFWTLFNRSFFFMVGGFILVVGGYVLEKQRRKLTNSIIQKPEDTEA